MTRVHTGPLSKKRKYHILVLFLFKKGFKIQMQWRMESVHWTTQGWETNLAAPSPCALTHLPDKTVRVYILTFKQDKTRDLKFNCCALTHSPDKTVRVYTFTFSQDKTRDINFNCCALTHLPDKTVRVYWFI